MQYLPLEKSQGIEEGVDRNLATNILSLAPAFSVAAHVFDHTLALSAAAHFFTPIPAATTSPRCRHTCSNCDKPRPASSCCGNLRSLGQPRVDQRSLNEAPQRLTNPYPNCANPLFSRDLGEPWYEGSSTIKSTALHQFSEERS